MPATTAIRVEQLPDRPYDTRRNLRYVGFLFKQPFMAVPTVVICIAWWAWLLVGGTAAPLLLAMGPVIGVGFALIVGLGGFMLVRMRRAADAPWRPAPSEPTRFEHAAVHWAGSESRDGTLYVTSREWVFVPSRFAVTQAVVREPHADVHTIQWYRSPAPEGAQSTSTIVLTTARGTTELLFRSLELASQAARSAPTAAA
jgi:hypothetical protein